MNLMEKLKILADAAKYDVSCSSSGSTRQGPKGTIGSAAKAGICHSFTADGRCISLLKILMTNNCVYDCAYCLNRRSNDRPRAAFTVDEIVSLTMEFYRRNYIEGLFLSSAIIGSPDYTMEQLVQVVERLRYEQHFHGYIHLKAIPGANPALIQRAGQVADRLSVNLELPSEKSLSLLAPDKKKQSILLPMQQIQQGIVQRKQERALSRKAPAFVPAGQTTQMMVGASQENDLQILRLSSALYQKFSMKRVYFSACRRSLSHPCCARIGFIRQTGLCAFMAFRPANCWMRAIPTLTRTMTPKLSGQFAIQSNSRWKSTQPLISS